MNLLQSAMRYVNAGLAVIPVWADRRKNPRLSTITPYLERLPNGEEWTRWAKMVPAPNIAAITGYWRNLVALDFDDFETYQAWADGPGYGVKGKTWTVATARGFHVWFKLASDPGESRNYVTAGRMVLLRARGGYCIVPPSVHHTGARYRTVHKVEPLEIASIEDVLTGWTIKQVKTPQAAQKPRSSQNFAVSIQDLIEPVGKPNSRGAYQAFCPFHEDKNPSAWVNPGQQRFGCNACWPGLWWDVINVYAMMNEISNSQAFVMIRKNSAIHRSGQAQKQQQLSYLEV